MWKRLISLPLCIFPIYGTHRVPEVYDFIEENVYLPVMKYLPPELSHKLALSAAKYHLPPQDTYTPDILKTQVLGINFNNPIGLAAGFDKDCEAILGLQRLGFGFVEVGSVTPYPQSGNDKPRVFRLDEDRAVINRYGFPSKGHDSARRNLAKIETKAQFTASLGSIKAVESDPSKISSRSLKSLMLGIQPSTLSCKIGVNLGVNKASINRNKDYLLGIEELGPFSDYLVINISSPNTPGLRDLQSISNLRQLLLDVRDKVVEVRNKTNNASCKSLLLKISPDLSDQDLEEIIQISMDPRNHVDGLIISNTTVSRQSTLKNSQKAERGGLSGQPLKRMSTEMIRKAYELSEGKLTIIGVGGVETAVDVYEKLRSGASLVQLYTGLVYNGLSSVRHMKEDLVRLLERDNFKSINDVIGIDVTTN